MPADRTRSRNVHVHGGYWNASGQAADIEHSASSGSCNNGSDFAEYTIALILDDDRIAKFTDDMATQMTGVVVAEQDDNQWWIAKRDAVNAVIDAAKAKNI